MSDFADLPEAEKQVEAVSALYQAKRSRASLALFKNGKYAHPFYSAGFVIIGDGE